MDTLACREVNLPSHVGLSTPLVLDCHVIPHHSQGSEESRIVTLNPNILPICLAVEDGTTSLLPLLQVN